MVPLALPQPRRRRSRSGRDSPPLTVPARNGQQSRLLADRGLRGGCLSSWDQSNECSVMGGWESQLVRDEFSCPLPNSGSVGSEPDMPVIICTSGLV